MLRKMLSMMLAVSLAASPFASAAPAAAVLAKEEKNPGTIIDVTDYGADPLGISDSEPAIKKAIKGAKTEEGPVTLFFPKGEYHFYPDEAYKKELYISNTSGTNQDVKMKNIGLLFEEMKNVTVDGNGSSLVFHGKMTSLSTISSTNVKFKNMAVDFAVPKVVDITVESIEDNTAIVYVPECYNYEISSTKKSITWKSDASPYGDHAVYWTGTNAMDYTQRYDLTTGLTWRGDTNSNPVFKNVSSIEDIGDHRLLFSYTSKDSDLKAGVCYQMRTTIRDHAGMFFWKSKDIVLEDVDIQFLHGFGVVGQSTENVSLLNVNFVTPEGSGRTTASYADFVQMSGCKGEILVDGCDFSNPHDDPINVHGTFMQVTQRISDTKFKVQYKHGETAGFPNFFVGDQVEFITKSTLLPVENSVAEVVAVEGPTGDAGASASGTSSLTDIIIELDKAMPSSIQSGTHVVENLAYTPSVVIKNNVFRNTPTRGILVTTRKKVEICDNLFDGMGMASIYISDDANSWYESGATEDVTIERNVFYRPTTSYAVIYVDPQIQSTVSGKSVHKSIKVKDNTFFVQNSQVMNARSVENIEFTGNKVYRYDPKIEVTLAAAEDSVAAGESISLSGNVSAASAFSTQLFSFNGCQKVTIDDNVYDGGLKLGVSLSGSMSASNVTIGDGEGFAVGNPVTTDTKGTIAYESSDTSIVKVSEDGTATGVGEGTAKVRACAIVGGRKFVSDWKEITVTGSPSSESKEDSDLPLSAEARLDSAWLTGVAGLDELEFDSENLSYLTTAEAEENVVSGTFEAKDENAKVEVSLNDRVYVESEASTAEISDVRLAPGSNVFEVKVTAEDEITWKTYRFVVIRKGSEEAGLTGISLNGKEISGFGAETDTYSYTTAARASSVKVEAETASDTVDVAIGKTDINTGKEAEIPLAVGDNTVYVRTRSELKTGTKVYQLQITVPDMDDELKAVQNSANRLLSAQKALVDKGQSNYTEESWKVFVDAYNELKKAMEEDRLNAEQLDVLMENFKTATTALKTVSSTDKQVTDKPVPQKPGLKKGDTYNIGNLQYKVLDPAKKTVSLAGVKKNSVKKTLKKLNVPATVTISGIKCTVTSIDNKAFSKCKRLANVVIGASVTSIGKQAFAGCSKLQKIKVKSKVLKKVGSKALKGIYKKAVISVPKKQKAKYKKLFKKKGQAATVKIR